MRLKVPRAVVDANVLVSAWMPPRTEKGRLEQNAPAVGVLRALEDGRLEMIHCRAIHNEYRRILHHRLLRIPQPEINQRLRGLMSLSTSVEPHRVDDALAAEFPDPDDLVYYETALGGDADWIVTSNICDFAASTIPVLSPVQCLELLRHEAAREPFWRKFLRRLLHVVPRRQP